MRAIIRCASPAHGTPEELQTKLRKTLEAQNWLPNLKEGDPELDARKAEILGHVTPEDRSLVEKTCFCTVYHDDTKTWGIVSNPTSHAFTFRLKNPKQDRLKAATEELVADLALIPSRTHKPDQGVVEFHPHIVVLEPNSDNSAFQGEILPAKGLGLAMLERKTETYVGALTLLLTILLLVVTSPPVAPIVLGKLSSSWQDWANGNLSRFATASLVTATISWFEVLLHWIQVRRQSSIRWTLE